MPGRERIKALCGFERLCGEQLQPSSEQLHWPNETKSRLHSDNTLNPCCLGLPHPYLNNLCVRRASACQAVSIGRVGSADHSNKEPSYTATLGTPSSVSTNASLLVAMPPPQ